MNDHIKAISKELEQAENDLMEARKEYRKALNNDDRLAIQLASDKRHYSIGRVSGLKFALGILK